MIDESSNVVPLPGIAGCHISGHADPDVVRQLRRLLAEAEAGEIVGFLYGVVRPGRGGISTGWEPGSAAAIDMMAASAGLHARISLVWVEQNEPQSNPLAG